MSESSLAALLSLKETAATIKCMAKQTRTVTNYPKESEGAERPFCHCTVIVQTLIIRLAGDSPGRWGIPVLSGNQIKPWHKDSGRILSDPIETQAAARKSMQLAGCCSWIKVLQEEASLFHLQGRSGVVLFAVWLFLTTNSCMQMFVKDAENTNTNIKPNVLP